ncbi:MULTISPECIES: LysR family transcriptional regulator [Pseudomonadaceae]|jgi:DNA-binding transcriptional LysR family regulator|uniref:LysR family transcriptional regulator n=2 Tax=Aquipseudomonas alcaligenes TaxID=43263 RepID=U2ZQC4_AQUA1|nr:MULTISPECIES: LysR family transcriptional regulator [Pseudomonas]MDC7825469.1 LysR family transcriptional regulator [Pseudomonas sp. BLCC-B13]MDH0143505.1 LysR family transcriptional regulator [Pseudomonas alcaligenes]MEE1947339.1 LysR family transcriptional regulator [Pseudomonas alcaligenes]NMY42845.1 LysR family transcriptional regulator [Pseudomonas sp. WS 5013]SUD14775.1 LysR family transcriptional regulator [Pseudomonas alcaligenes]
MGLDDALIFTRVVECHSFTQAAQSLGMQKSTVSRRIALLEERLGVRLLNRTTRKLRLTEVGQAYYERCRQIMLDFAEAEQAVMQLQQAPSGLLRITAPIEFGQLFLGRVLGEFMRQYPQISAEVELTSRDVDPLEEGVDIAIQVGQPRDSTLIARKLFESRRRLCASPAYLAQHGTPRTVQELAGHRALHLPVDSPRHWPLLGENIACQRVLACNNITLAREAALAGAGIAALPVMISEAAVQDGELIELLPEARLPTGELYAVYPSRRFQAMKVKAFLDFLIASLPQAGLLEPAGAGLLTSRL